MRKPADKQAQCVRNKITKKTRPHTSTSLKRNSSQAVRTDKAHRGSREQMGTQHVRLPSQMPASSVSKSPGGNNRQERKNAVSSQEDGKHKADYCGGKQEKEEEKNSTMFWELEAHCSIVRVAKKNVKASVNNTWQISPFCHTVSRCCRA